MVILHVGMIDKFKCSGVNIVVPIYIKHQEKYANVAFLNLTNQVISDVKNEFNYKFPGSLNKLPCPFNRPDIIVFHQVYRLGFLLIYREAIKNNIPYVIIPHGGLARQVQAKRGLLKLVANYLFFFKFIKKANYVQFLSKDEMLNAFLYPKNWFILPYGIDEKKLNIVKNKREFVDFAYIGRLDIKTKGIDLLLCAIENVVKKCNERFILNIYGPNIKNEHVTIKRLISEKHLEDNVKIHDSVFDNDKKNVLMKSDVFVLTSRNEGLPLGVMEALSYGVPCLVTKGTSFADIVNKYQAGWGCDTNVEDISIAIMQAIKDVKNGVNKSANALLLVKEEYSWDVISKKSIAVYNKILLNNNR